MKTTKIAFLLVLTIALAVLVLQNTASVKVHFLWLTGEMPAVVLLFLTASTGFILGLIVALLVKNRAKSKSQGRG